MRRAALWARRTPPPPWAVQLILEEGFSVERVARLMGVGRTNLDERVKRDRE